jgi:hypothetical protein
VGAVTFVFVNSCMWCDVRCADTRVVDSG